jgi:hypothetical protein
MAYSGTNFTFFNLFAGNAYIGFRNRIPDEATSEKAFKAFNETDLDNSQLVKWSADDC